MLHPLIYIVIVEIDKSTCTGFMNLCKYIRMYACIEDILVQPIYVAKLEQELNLLMTEATRRYVCNYKSCE